MLGKEDTLIGFPMGGNEQKVNDVGEENRVRECVVNKRESLIRMGFAQVSTSVMEQ